MLKYLFLAEFEDGSFIQQDQADVSKLDPSKNQLHDVLSHPSKLVRFTLGSNFGSLSLNLLTGQFVVNESSFTVHDPSKREPTERKLIYFKRHTHSTCNGEQTHDIVYHLGWQATIDGEKTQHTVAVS